VTKRKNREEKSGDAQTLYAAVRSVSGLLRADGSTDTVPQIVVARERVAPMVMVQTVPAPLFPASLLLYRASDPSEHEPGLKEFLVDRSFSGEVSPEGLRFLQALRFEGEQPTSLYLCRELQNLRDTLHVWAK
jgi:hypothetical protein